MSLPAASRLLRSALRLQQPPAAGVASKAAKHPVSGGEQVVAMTALFVAILGPSGWVLSHLEDYKKKE